MGAPFGHTVSPETRKKLRLAILGKKHKPETIEKMRIWHQENKNWCEGTKGVCKPNSGSFKKGQFAKDKHPKWKGGISRTREYENHYTRVSKARRRGATGRYSSEEWESLKEKFNHECA